MTKDEVKKARQTIAAALKTAEKQLGYSLQIGTIRYGGPNGLRFKVTAFPPTLAKPKQHSKIGVKFTYAGVEYEVVEYKPSGRRYKFIAVNKAGRRFKITEQMIP